ncbi:MAG: paraquat-inducible protein A [Marinobacter sp.]|uniref:paraquat-inducible protein A n=1 Tax=Marinobacter sp. TaxID=50741 RepID=UPI00299D1FFA|nr:paraquat-inducible protein A [Marinobacter sp.]MDX1634827.1 paraquat-inducible protein A [Marinobacter sp.]
MRHSSELIICEYCDSVYQRPDLARHERAHCQRCGAILSREPWLNLDQLFALSVAAGLLLLLVCFSPVLFVHAQGQVNSATLLEAVLALLGGPMTLMAITAGMALVLVPAAQLTLLIWLLAFARLGRQAPGFLLGMRALEVLRPWSMLEVFLLGALVAVVKLTGRIDAAPAIGLFALGALSLLMIGVAGRDVRMLWEQVT